MSKSSEKAAHIRIREIDTFLTYLKDKLISITGYTNALAREISTIVVSIQFQDITRQRMEHIISPIEEILDELTALQKNLHDVVSENSTTNKEVGEWLSKFYTMEDEKKVLAECWDKYLFYTK
jgi:methyl-accepting chemotaxis protein